MGAPALPESRAAHAPPADGRDGVRLLLAWLAPPGSGGDGRIGGRSGVPGERWRELVDLAGRHGLAPLLYRRLASRSDSIRVPDGVRRELREVFLHSRLRTRSALAQLGELLEALAAEGIPTLVLKGPDVGERAYDDPATRPYHDLDLLLRPRDLGRGASVLRRLGYRASSGDPAVDYDRHHHLAPFRREGSLPVEIHRRLQDGEIGVRMDHEGIWRRSRPTRIAGAATRVLALPDLLIHLAVHAGGNHRFEVPLLALCDVAYLLDREEESLDWGEVVARSRENGAGRYLRPVLRAAADRIGVPVPSRVLDELAGDDPDDSERIDSLAEAHLLDGGGVELPAALRRLRRSGGRRPWTVVRQSVFPDRRRLARTYPGFDGRWYHLLALRLLRPLDLVRRSVALVLDVLRRSPDADRAVRRDRRRHQLERWVRESSPGI